MSKKEKLSEEEKVIRRRASAKKWQDKNRETERYKARVKAQNRRAYFKLTASPELLEKEKERNRLRTAKLRKENPELAALWHCKTRAKRLGLDFNLELEDIKTPEYCPVLGIPLFRTIGKKTHNTPSIDRIDTTKGYVKGNVRVISHKANTWKSNMTIDDVKALLVYMENNT